MMSPCTQSPLAVELARLQQLVRVSAGRADAAELERLFQHVRLHQIELENQLAELHETKAALEDSSHGFAELLAATPIAFLTLDGQAVIREVNRAGARLIGLDRTLLLGTPLLSFVEPGGSAPLWEHLRSCAESGHATTELRLVTRRDVTLCMQLTSVCTKEGLFPTTLADVLGPSEAEAELARVKAEAHDAIKVHEELLLTLTHDLRGPLSSILLGTEIIRRSRPPHDRRSDRKQIDRIGHAGERMRWLIDDLLVASAIELGSFEIHPRLVEVRPLLDATIEIVSPIASSRGVRLELTTAELWSAPLDPERLQQALVDLLGHAIKFAPEEALVGLLATRTGEEVEVVIHDPGPGVPDSQLPSLFDRYPKGEGRRRRTGLGLFIARSIVERHGGRIWAERGPAEGLAIHLTIPARAPAGS